MITAEYIINKGKNKLCLHLGNRITHFQQKKCLTTVLIGIELNQYKGVWKGKKSSRWALQLLPFFSVIYNFNNSSITEGD